MERVDYTEAERQSIVDSYTKRDCSVERAAREVGVSVHLARRALFESGVDIKTHRAYRDAPIVYPAGIREANLKDSARIEALCTGLFEYEHAQGFIDDSYNTRWPRSRDGATYIRQLLDARHPQYVAFIAYVGAEFIGYLAASVSTVTYRRPDRVAEINSMYVIERLRRRGFGASLVRGFELWARNAQAGILTVSAATGNHPAQDFYRKVGFGPTEVTLEKALP